ncbi:MAG: hypothetical protein R3B72_44680 [Polyangiaceae bacterium]
MDWPYDDDDGHPPEPTGPIWDCPDDICRCDVAEGGEELEFAVRLLSPIGKAIPRAICRIRHGGRVVNEHQPKADDFGWITGFVPHAPTTVIVEWAPENAPQDPGYPYRRRYFVDLGSAHREMSKRRLHNLGFWKKPSLRENVEEFQRHYGYPKVTGNLEDIEDDLEIFHDTGSPPSPDTRPQILDAEPPDQGTARSPVEVMPDGVFAFAPVVDRGGGDGTVLAFDHGDHDLQDPIIPAQVPLQQPSDPPAPQRPRIGPGCVQLASVLPTVKQALDKGIALFELAHVASTWTDPKDPSRTVSGAFWMFTDALMIELPNDAEWNWWKGTQVDNPFPVQPFGGVAIKDRKRLIRLPCKGKEAEAALSSLSFTQSELLTSRLSLGIPFPKATSPDKMPSLLSTAELYDLSYEQADVRIPVISVNPNQGCIGEVTAYAEKLALAVDASMKKAGITKPRTLGTPGKIWAITDRMDTWVCCCQFSSWVFACINHGFHERIITTRHGRPVLTPRTAAAATTSTTATTRRFARSSRGGASPKTSTRSGRGGGRPRRSTSRRRSATSCVPSTPRPGSPRLRRTRTIAAMCGTSLDRRATASRTWGAARSRRRHERAAAHGPAAKASMDPSAVSSRRSWGALARRARRAPSARRMRLSSWSLQRRARRRSWWGRKRAPSGSGMRCRSWPRAS